MAADATNQNAPRKNRHIIYRPNGRLLKAEKAAAVSDQRERFVQFRAGARTGIVAVAAAREREPGSAPSPPRGSANRERRRRRR